MNSRTTASFRRCLKSLPPHVRDAATKAYRLFSENPYHTSLRFKKVHATEVHATERIYSARVTQDYRALYVLTRLDPTGEFIGPTIAIWFWIGSHADYDKMI